MYLRDVKKTVIDGNRYLDRQETVRIISAYAKRLIQDYVDTVGHNGSSVTDCLFVDGSSEDEFPYLVLLLLYRAGEHQAAVQFCNRSN